MVCVFGHNREQNVAKTALALMGEVGVVATPDNFELFYAFTSGENPALSQVMAAFIKSKKPFTAEILSDLRLRFVNKGQAWVVRKIDEVLPMIADETARAMLDDMRRSHVDNIAACDALLAGEG